MRFVLAAVAAISLGAVAGAAQASVVDFTTMQLNVAAPAAVPGPETWALMFLGFAGVGAAARSLRRRQRLALV